MLVVVTVRDYDVVGTRANTRSIQPARVGRQLRHGVGRPPNAGRRAQATRNGARCTCTIAAGRGVRNTNRSDPRPHSFPQHRCYSRLTAQLVSSATRATKVPTVLQLPGAKELGGNAEANARLTHVYFRAWTLNAAEESENVPFLGHLLGKRESGKSPCATGCSFCRARKRNETSAAFVRVSGAATRRSRG